MEAERIVQIAYDERMAPLEAVAVLRFPAAHDGELLDGWVCETVEGDDTSEKLATCRSGGVDNLSNAPIPSHHVDLDRYPL